MILLSLAANHGWRLQQFDIKIAFLHENLEEEEVYMEVPPGFNTNTGHVYVDIIVTGDDLKGIDNLKKCLVKEFENAFLHGDLEEEVYMDIPPGFNSNTGQAVCNSLTFPLNFSLTLKPTTLRPAVHHTATANSFPSSQAKPNPHISANDCRSGDPLPETLDLPRFALLRRSPQLWLLFGHSVALILRPSLQPMFNVVVSLEPTLPCHGLSAHCREPLGPPFELVSPSPPSPLLGSNSSARTITLGSAPARTSGSVMLASISGVNSATAQQQLQQNQQQHQMLPLQESHRKSSSPTTTTTSDSSTSSKSPPQNLDDLPIAIPFTATLDARQIPKTVDEALRDPKWKKAVEEELAALENNATWTVTNLPPGKKAVGLCHLHKSSYGLKQSPRTWFERFTKVVLRNGYKQSLADHTLCLKEHSNGKKAILLIYVDDIIITVDDEGEIAKLKQLLNSEFETQDLGFLRPDIAFAVNILSQHMSNPNEHMAAAYRILKYLKKTPGHGLLFKKSSDRSIKVFTDSSWASNLTDRRSTSGYCTFLWGNLVTWRSKKQSLISSSAEAEFRALAQAICEGIWLLKLLREVDPNSADYFDLLSDNNSAIQIAKNPVQHDCTKHVEIDRHFIAEKIKKGTAKLFYIPTDGQLADILTKALPKPAFDSIKCKLGIYNVYTPA
ncbi:hypothetical protein GQ457_04G023640 [Hibiscus cannabinus]